ncbi:YeiH family putative sulfate export transporter [Diaphorobacter sp. HDW4A]|uniref:YeiH family protein n=1 Tax=Diaphorobacter sp. HDW4A TaxID=2714924 RepID=UPI0014089D4B|nr:YeiH family protein [Diaphorobacter sp. HDW4A]QIL80039.1 YeiH family putative sulfate export transporter [Diaphorobacter sp. HDW4A]
MSTAKTAGHHAPSPAGSLWAKRIPGILLCAAIAGVASYVGSIEWFASHGLSVLTLAIIIGMVLGNTIYGGIASTAGTGVGYTKQTLLRLGIVLYGFRLTTADIAHVGMAGVLIDAIIVGSTFMVAMFVGTRWLGMDRKQVMLIGAGSSICGAAAVLGTEPVVKARADQVTVAVATVVVFGTICIFLYPALYQWNQTLGFIPGGATEFGIYTGATVHEVAQVVAAGRAMAPEAADTAIVTKMVRVMMLAPFLLILSAYLARTERAEAGADGKKTKMTLPWFAFGFVAVVLFNSLNLVPKEVVTNVNTGANVLLAMAMAGLGLTTHASAIKNAGAKPLVLALILAVWLVVGGGLINRFLLGA